VVIGPVGGSTSVLVASLQNVCVHMTISLPFVIAVWEYVDVCNLHIVGN